MEGERGRERLELQRTYGGDDRFKLGADFMNDDSDDDVPIHETANVDDTDAEDEISAELSQEKSTSMDVLKAMFGEDNRTALRFVSILRNTPHYTSLMLETSGRLQNRSVGHLCYVSIPTPRIQTY